MLCNDVGTSWKSSKGHLATLLRWSWRKDGPKATRQHQEEDGVSDAEFTGAKRCNRTKAPRITKAWLHSWKRDTIVFLYVCSNCFNKLMTFEPKAQNQLETSNNDSLRESNWQLLLKRQLTMIGRCLIFCHLRIWTELDHRVGSPKLPDSASQMPGLFHKLVNQSDAQVFLLFVSCCLFPWEDAL